MNDLQTRPTGEMNLGTTRAGMCASCGEDTTFTFAGEQRCPERVTRVTGLPPLLHLWTCDTCQTTIAETPSES